MKQLYRIIVWWAAVKPTCRESQAIRRTEHHSGMQCSRAVLSGLYRIFAWIVGRWCDDGAERSHLAQKDNSSQFPNSVTVNSEARTIYREAFGGIGVLSTLCQPTDNDLQQTSVCGKSLSGGAFPCEGCWMLCGCLWGCYCVDSWAVCVRDWKGASAAMLSEDMRNLAKWTKRTKWTERTLQREAQQGRYPCKARPVRGCPNNQASNRLH